MKRMIAGLMALMLALTFVGCGKETEESTTTVSGMVTEVNGTVISLMEMDSSMGGGRNFADGERPSMPENMEGFENFEGFEGGSFPWGEGEMPEFAEGEMPEKPEGGEMPEFAEGEMPEMPTGEDGEMQWPAGKEGKMPNMEDFEYEGETTEIDIGSAHISIEEDGVKASGSLSDITVGCFVTITRNADGEVTNVLVTSNAGFGGGMGGFRDFGNFGGDKPTSET